MKIKLSRIVIGDNITGMQIALKNDAVFIPVSFIPSFGWEFLKKDHPCIENLRKYKTELPLIQENKYKITTEEGSEYVPCFLWELEALYRYILIMSNRMFDSSRVKSIKHYSENEVTIVTEFGSSKIEFEKCWIVNPNSTWFDSYLLPTKTYESEFAHLIYYLILAKDTPDMKGVSISYDSETLDDEYFTKVWYHPLFGPKKLLLGNDPKRKRKTISSRHLCFFIENVNIENISDYKYEIAEIRKEIYKLTAPHYKRISDRILSFDKSITRFDIKTNLDVYENTKDVEFVYYTDKEEILCQENLDFSTWPQSYPRILISQMKETTISL